jgi:hypothetical protein
MMKAAFLSTLILALSTSTDFAEQALDDKKKPPA